MLKGIGVDLASIDRIEGVLRKHGDRFLKRVFTPAEAAYCMAMPRPGAHLAARFAAKEAVKKAAGPRLGWKEIEVINERTGKPRIRLKNPADNETVLLSLSHSDEHAVAFVTVEEKY